LTAAAALVAAAVDNPPTHRFSTTEDAATDTNDAKTSIHMNIPLFLRWLQ